MSDAETKTSTHTNTTTSSTPNNSSNKDDLKRSLATLLDDVAPPSSSSAHSSSDTTITIKKRNNKTQQQQQRRIRSSTTDHTTHNDDDTQHHDKDDTKRRMEDVKLMQRVRGRAKGVSTMIDHTGDESTAVVADDDGSAASAEAKLLASDFQAEVVVNPVDKQLEKYIAEQMALRQGKSTSELEEKKERSADDKLYETPDHLKYTKPLTGQEEEAGERWLTGIAEVPLDISYKIKNIEETELAKQNLAANRGKPVPPILPTRKRIGGGGRDRTERSLVSIARDTASSSTSNTSTSSASSAVLPVNMSTNFSQHQRDYAHKVRSQQSSSSSGGSGNERRHSSSNGAAASASDDKAVDRFIKRFKWSK